MSMEGGKKKVISDLPVLGKKKSSDYVVEFECKLDLSLMNTNSANICVLEM